MKNIAEFGIGCFILALVLGGGAMTALAAALFTPSGFVLLSGLTLIGGLVVAVFLAVAGLLLWSWVGDIQAKHALSAEFIQPDANGRLPVHVEALRTGAGAAATFETYKASYMQNVSHYHNNKETVVNGAEQQTMIEAVADEAAVVAPSFAELYQLGKLPDKGFLMGFDMDTGAPVIIGWADIASTLIGGLSQTGKSTLVRGLLAQAALQGSRFIVIDRHYSSGEKSLGGSLEPLGELVQCIAHDDKTIMAALKLVVQIGQARLNGVDKDRTPLVLVVDEITALLLRDGLKEVLINVLGLISQETAKVNVYALCIGQNFHSKVMDTTVRNSFVSFISTRARQSVARVMAEDNEFASLASALEIGQAVWLTPGGRLLTLAVPNCTAADLEMVTGSGYSVVDEDHASTSGNTVFQTHSKRIPEATKTAQNDDTGMPSEYPGNGSGMRSGMPTASQDPRVEHVRRLTREGKTSIEIVKEIWQVSQGSAYVKAQAELAEIMRTLV